MSSFGVFIVDNIPCWDFPNPIKECLTKMHYLKGQNNYLSDFKFFDIFQRFKELEFRIESLQTQANLQLFLPFLMMQLYKSCDMQGIGIGHWIFVSPFVLKMSTNTNLTFSLQNDILQYISISVKAWNIQVPLWVVLLNFMPLRQLVMVVDG